MGPGADRIDMGDYSARYVEQYQAGSFETVMVAVRRAQVVAAIERRSARRILEVGCGLEPLFVHATGWDTFAVVEPAAEFVARARELARDQPGVSVHEGYLENAAPMLADMHPDFIVLSSLLHEVPDARALLRSVRGVANAQTVVHINVPNVMSFHRLLAVEMGAIADVFEPSEMERRFQRQRRFDLAALVNLVQSEGFRVVDSGSYFIKPFTHAQMARMLDAGTIDATVLLGLERMSRHLPGMGAEIFVEALPE